MGASLGSPDVLEKMLLACGIIAALLFLGADQLAGRMIAGYSFTVQSMSELSAAGSPTRRLVVGLHLAASVLLVAFAVGVWRAAGGALLPRIVAGLILIHALTGLAATLFFPNRYGVRPEIGEPGVLLMMVSVLCFTLAFVFGALAFPGWMRLLSIAIPAAYILLAGLRFATAAGNPGSQALIGVQERSMAYSFLGWVAALAVYLLRW